MEVIQRRTPSANASLFDKGSADEFAFQGLQREYEEKRLSANQVNIAEGSEPSIDTRLLDRLQRGAPLGSGSGGARGTY